MSAADQLARMALGTMEQECGHGIGDAAMGPFVDTHGSILLARRKLDAATRQVRKIVPYFCLFSLGIPHHSRFVVFTFAVAGAVPRHLAAARRAGQLARDEGQRQARHLLLLARYDERPYFFSKPN